MTPHEPLRCGVHGDASFWCMEEQFLNRLWKILYFLALATVVNTYFWIMGRRAVNDQGIPKVLISLDKLCSRSLGKPYSFCWRMITKSIESLDGCLSLVPRFDPNWLFLQAAAIDKMLQRLFGKLYKVPQQRISPWTVRLMLLIMFIVTGSMDFLELLKQRYVKGPYEQCQQFLDARYTLYRRALNLTDWHLQHLRHRRDCRSIWCLERMEVSKPGRPQLAYSGWSRKFCRIVSRASVRAESAGHGPAGTMYPAV